MRVGKRVANQKQYSRRLGSGLAAPASRSLIPQILGDLRGSTTIRYQALTAIVGGFLTYADFLRSLLVNLNGATSWATLLESVKIRRVDVYDIGGSTDVSLSTTSWAWVSANGPARDLSVTGTPIHPGTLSTSPPAKSLAGDWISANSSGAVVVAYISIPLSSIVDVTLDFVLNSNALTVPTVITSGSGATGAQAANRLDQSGSGFLKCISMNAF